MFKVLKRFVPLEIKKVYWRYLKKKKNLRNKKIVFSGTTTKDVFTNIYATNYWKSGESISGGGSEKRATKHITLFLPSLFKELNIKSLLDLPCGDFNWMRLIDLTGIDYIGGDIVNELIDSNKRKFDDRENVEFEVIDLLTDVLPLTDLIMCRDCLVHFSFSDIKLAIENIKNSGSKYLLTTTFSEHPNNEDIVTGDWRPLNLELPPFNFNPPLKIYNEKYEDPRYKSKSLALWRIKDL